MFEQALALNNETTDNHAADQLVLLAELQLATVGGGIGDVVFA